MPPKDPFAGIRLSEQASAGKLDQRLFASDHPQAIPAPAPAWATIPAVAVQPEPLPGAAPPQPDRESETANTAPPKAKPSSTRDSPWNLNDEPLYKATFVFTQDELNALTDLKEELRRALDTKVTKYDLVRAALHLLFEDHHSNGPKSFASRKVRKR